LPWSSDFVAHEHSLRLAISEFDDADRWRWRLTDAQGAFLADHAVALDRNEPKYQALFNLPDYLWQHSVPDKRDQDERRLVSEVGAWIGETVLGRDIGEKIVASGHPPITVRVVVPQAAERLLVVPLEIAHVRGKPLATQGVSLVFESPGVTPPTSAPVGERLRMLAVFSLPPAGVRSTCGANGKCCARSFAAFPHRRSSCAFSNTASPATPCAMCCRREKAGIFSIFPVTGCRARWFWRSLTAGRT
jgi:hypothetical protein